MKIYKKNEYDIIYSIILGDGSIYKSDNSYTIFVGHGASQKDYLKWKCDLINSTPISSNALKINSKLTSLNKQTGKQYLQYYFKKTNKDFKQFFDCYYSQENRINNILNNLHSDRALSIWFMDDGATVKRRRKHVDGSIWYDRPTLNLCTHCFTEEENIDILKWFKKKYLIDGKLNHDNKRGKKYTYLRFNSAEAFKIFTLIRPYIEQIESMRKKFDFFYEYYKL